MAADEDLDWLVRVYEEQGPTLHRLAVLLDAEDQSTTIVRSAMLALQRRSNRLVDPAERVEFLQEHVVHLARAVRPPQAPLRLPRVEDQKHQDVLRTLTALPHRTAELIVVSHYLAVFGPELAGIMRMTVRSCNQRLEAALEALGRSLGRLGPGTETGGIESLSQEITAALRTAAAQVQTPGTEELEKELTEIAHQRRDGVSTRVVAAVTVIAVVVGLLFAVLTRPTVTATENPSVSASASPSASPSPSATPSASASASQSMPAQVRDVPLYYVGRQSGGLYRELRDLPSTGNLVRGAIEALLSLAPLDPDYSSAWGPGSVNTTDTAGDVLTVDLTADAFEDITTLADAQRARDQVVYTASELVGDLDLRVKFLQDGAAPPEAFVSATGFTRSAIAPMPELWITSPENGAKLTAGQLVIIGTVKPGVGEPIVTITDLETELVVAQTSAQTSTGVNGDGWRVWSVSVQLNAGSYDIRAAVTWDDPPERASENKSVTVS